MLSSISILSISSISRIQVGTTTYGRSEPGSNGTPQNSRSGALPSDAV